MTTDITRRGTSLEFSVLALRHHCSSILGRCSYGGCFLPVPKIHLVQWPSLIISCAVHQGRDPSFGSSVSQFAWVILAADVDPQKVQGISFRRTPRHQMVIPPITSSYSTNSHRLTRNAQLLVPAKASYPSPTILGSEPFLIPGFLLDRQACLGFTTS